ncbi:MAG: Dabb family protein [Clostridia bacterium]|nr:Dabb family protein [Clostridia bacterium]
MVTHIVLFKLEQPEIHAPIICKMLMELKDKIPEIVSMQTGIDFLHSGRSYDMALIVTFNDREGLEAYDKNPDHNEVRKYIHAHRLDSKTVDFEV